MTTINGATTGRDFHLASNRTLALPLPRLSATPDLSLGKDGSPDQLQRHEVVIVGAGPAGLFLYLLLSRYGLPSTRAQPSLLCIDSTAQALKTGHADGIFPRTLEVLRSLDLSDEILRHAAHIRESGNWGYDEATDGIKRKLPVQSLKLGDMRFGEGFECMHQGRMERILEDDLKPYSATGVVRNTKCVDVWVDEEGDPEFPVVAVLERNGARETVRTKYLVGADGGRSKVRRSLGIKMEGETLDDVWGVLDVIADSDYPDLRRQSFIATKNGEVILHIPREKKSNGNRITRLYIPFSQQKGVDAASVANGEAVQELEGKQRSFRAGITLEMLLKKAADGLRPYRFKMKEGTDVEWWTAYQVGQRVASPFTVPDSKDHPRVFLIGDACHTHSPKMGQGMNMSMMDAFNLSWKLAHSVFGLTGDGTGLLQTYDLERRDNAWNLINMDKLWYTRRYKNTDRSSKAPDLLQSEIGAEVKQFIAGTGVEYEAETMIVDARVTKDDVELMASYRAGALREGRRIEDCLLTRLADGNVVHLHDEIDSDGRYSFVIWTGRDLLDKEGPSQQVLEQLGHDVVSKFPAGLVKIFVIHNLAHLSFEWADLPDNVKIASEMRLYRGDEDVYQKFGIDPQVGRMCILRPDLHIGTIGELEARPEGLEKIAAYLRRCLVRVN